MMPNRVNTSKPIATEVDINTTWRKRFGTYGPHAAKNKDIFGLWRDSDKA